MEHSQVPVKQSSGWLFLLCVCIHASPGCDQIPVGNNLREKCFHLAHGAEDTVPPGLGGVAGGLALPMAADSCFLRSPWVRIQRKVRSFHSDEDQSSLRRGIALFT